MTVSAAQPMPPADAAPTRTPRAGRPISRSFLRRALGDTFARVGARVGLAWIAVVAFFAVFAPFVASSHPYFMLRAGRAEFPLFRYLTFPDFLALSVTLAAVLTFAIFRRASMRVRLAIFVGTIALVATVAGRRQTPRVDGYDVYREGEANGSLTHVIRAPLPYSPRDRLRDKAELWDSRPPSASHWFGTTPNREDVLSSMMHACRIAIQIGFISTGIAVCIGVCIGGLMGYFAGKVDLVGMRLIEIFEAIPTLFLLITFVAFYGRNIYLIMAIIGLVNWTGDARFIRGQFLQLRDQDFVHAARAMGIPVWSILFRHMLPNGISPVLVSASFGVATAILAEATLSFLGLGLIDEPSWGVMLNQARGVGTTFNWWLAVFPGGAIFLTVFAYNLIGEAFRDALDPKLKKRE